jgi:hypothetical protein
MLIHVELVQIKLGEVRLEKVEQAVRTYEQTATNVFSPNCVKYA